MKLLAIVTIALLIAVATYRAFSPEELPPSSQQPESAQAEPVVAPVSAEPVLAASTIAEQSKEAAILRQRIEELQSQLRAVVAERRSADAALAQAEDDVTELERYLEEIKARGEDPTDYADEGAARFVPAFEAYQRAYEQHEAAVAMENSITAELAVAEQALANN